LTNFIYLQEQYFNRYHGGLQSPTNPTGFIWHFNGVNGNPIDGYNPGLSIDDPINQAALRSNIRKPGIGAFLLAAALYSGLGLLVL